MKNSTKLRKLIARPEGLMAPGVYDGLSARMALNEGFDALYMTGNVIRFRDCYSALKFEVPGRQPLDWASRI